MYALSNAPSRSSLIINLRRSGVECLTPSVGLFVLGLGASSLTSPPMLADPGEAEGIPASSSLILKN